MLWSPGPLVRWSSGLSILWSLVAAFGKLDILGASEKIGLRQPSILVAFDMLRRLQSQENFKYNVRES